MRARPWQTKESPRKPARRHYAALVVALGIFALASGLMGWFISGHTIRWTIQRGRELLASAESDADREIVLAEWTRVTGSYWKPRPERLLDALYKADPARDLDVRLMIERVAGANYGDRSEDWKRWYADRRGVAAGESPRTSAAERIRLEATWEAPIGRTGWFSTLLPLDGRIFIGSLGIGFEQADDTGDGVVVIDGATGESGLIFRPPDAWPHDILGIAAGDDALFAACRNGFVYCIRPDGALVWKTRAGSRLVSPPLALDFNRNGAMDVLVVTDEGRVVALSGVNGKASWNVSIARRADIGAVLAATGFRTGALEVLVTLVTGEIRILNAPDGKERWRGDVPAGSLAGAISREPTIAPSWLGDRDATVWSVNRVGRTYAAAPVISAAGHAGLSFVAGLRTTSTKGGGWLIACPTGEFRDNAASLCAFDHSGLVWRTPVAGAIWATPAVANLNQVSGSEFVVAAIVASGEQPPTGRLQVYSNGGHLLRQLALPAAIECSPVVSDVDGDHLLEVLVADQAGMLRCYRTGRAGAVEWGLCGGDPHNTRNVESAYSFGQTPFGYQWAWKPR